MKKFLVVFVLLLVSILIGCGNDKKESGKTDTGDTETVADADPANTSDNEVATDGDNSGAETEDEEMQPDIDWNEIPDDGSCTIKSSFGAHSVKKEISETCIQEIAKAEFALCSWNYKNEKETSKHIAYLKTLKITFGKECKDKNGEETVECPDFIPETLGLKSITGCDVYSVSPYAACMGPCADLYFSTNDDVFHTVYVGDEYGGYPFIKSSDSIKEASFFTYMDDGIDYALFSWSEKAEDGSEIEKEVRAFRKIVDPVTGEGEEEEVPDEDIILAQCEDSEGRIYKEGDLISDGCGALICSEEGFVPYEAYGGMSCYDGCDPELPTSIKYWFCTDGSDLEWCICEEDAEHGSKRNCVERIDLQCPTE